MCGAWVGFRVYISSGFSVQTGFGLLHGHGMGFKFRV